MQGADAMPLAGTAGERRAGAAAARTADPALGFLGVGWIGRNRLQALASSGCAGIAAVADPSAEALAAALETAPGAVAVDGLDGLLAAGVEGVVIATPSAQHADQAVRALEAGCAVFCQKPLGRTAAEVRRVVEAARAADRLLAVDLSYRFTAAAAAVRDRVRRGALGRVYAVDLVFHNAWGPDAGWFRDPALSGGGCVIDLGVHLVDLALWTLGFPAVERADARLFAAGRRLAGGEALCEDYAEATLDVEGGAVVRLACSWGLAAGRDAVIEASFHGTSGGASIRNVAGSFYDFTAEAYRGTAAEVLVVPPDAWGGRAALAWARRLAAGERFDPAAERLVEVHGALDAIYGR
jgi:predicted dehydrogenase